MKTVPSNTFNMLVILTDTDSRAPLAFVLVGLDAPDKRLTVMPLPAGLSTGGGTLSNIFNQSGATETAAACASLLKVPIDYRWVQDSSSLAQVIDLYGGVDCDLPAAASAHVPHGAQVQVDKGKQLLNGAKVEAVACYASNASPADRLSMEGAVFQALLQQKCTGRYLDPAVCGDLFDMVRTNFSMDDLLSDEKALRQAAGHVELLLPEAGSSGTDSLTSADMRRIQKSFGRQNRRYAP